MDENLLAVDLVDPMGDDREDEEGDGSDRDEEIDGIVHDRVEERSH